MKTDGEALALSFVQFNLDVLTKHKHPNALKRSKEGLWL